MPRNTKFSQVVEIIQFSFANFTIFIVQKFYSVLMMFFFTNILTKNYVVVYFCL